MKMGKEKLGGSVRDCGAKSTIVLSTGKSAQPTYTSCPGGLSWPPQEPAVQPIRPITRPSRRRSVPFTRNGKVTATVDIHHVGLLGVKYLSPKIIEFYNRYC